MEVYGKSVTGRGPERGKGGQNKLFQNASLLMCYCSFAIGQRSTLKNQSERTVMEMSF